ncbi:MAG: cyclic nucleotide-binding domain-containing protein [gamma proteobacterium symbiont of Bathyaustriella thionipta]|nr:cyclic nucleotide-binding domain-containing protein [gamma proteobacterium symbiont of Bathyaustriella thionipta]MCU7949994.1 cyclic nucleotide-binding domain-containing protein [gamma proteobacterium symbiont of Bathyaustriella thionipta]MCU7952142.1 cyclic nucleotide-binding domain-containing protein [gamma proteobacterium symbiont of Bathyaustriella thionipta]MCU7956576.1 cyclic nucleotide-binding domain-containing protein [gamma proteobacterium symbiont of Bathyaustriella thionipta]MCU79
MTDTSTALKPIIDFLHHYEPFSRMSSAHQEYLAMHLEQVFFAESDTILSSQQGMVDCFYIIKNGLVSAEGEMNTDSASPEEASNPIMILKSGECFPVMALKDKRAVFFQHRAIKSTICYKLNYRHFEYLMQQSNIFHRFISKTNS